MAYQGTNLVLSSQADSCTMHGFAAAEVGTIPHSLSSICLHPGCGAAFSGAESLDLQVRGHDFDHLRLPERVISHTGAGYGEYPGCYNGIFEDNIATYNDTGYADPFGASLGNNVGATTYVGNEENVAYENTRYADAFDATIGNNIGATTYVGNEENVACDNTGYAYPFDPSLGNIGATTYVGNEENATYENTGHTDPFGDSIGDNIGGPAYAGHEENVAYENAGYTYPFDPSLGNNNGATTYASHTWNPTCTAAPSVNNMVGSSSGTGPWMPPVPPTIGGNHPTGPPAQAAQAAQVGPTRVACTHPNCSRTFGRPSDLARHAKKHEINPVRHSCPVPGCRFTGSDGFLRHDKLLSHGRKAHGMEF